MLDLREMTHHYVFKNDFERRLPALYYLSFSGFRPNPF